MECRCTIQWPNQPCIEDIKELPINDKQKSELETNVKSFEKYLVSHEADIF